MENTTTIQSSNPIVAPTPTSANNTRTQLQANIDACIPGTWAHAEAESYLMSDVIFESTAVRLQAVPFLGQALSEIYAYALGITGFASVAVGIATLPAGIFSTTMKQFSFRAINYGETFLAYAIVCSINANTFGAIAIFIEVLNLWEKISPTPTQEAAPTAQTASPAIEEPAIWHNNPLFAEATAQ